jgi:DNA polymerase III sliding clamp (beta) subunit (PCNA family)
MNTLEILRFVKGAVSTKDLIPVLKNFHLYEGRIQGTNGRVTIDAAFPGAAYNVTVLADKFVKAIDSCITTATVKVQDSKLLISSGAFTARLALADHSGFPRAVKEGKIVKNKQPLLPTLRLLRQFVSEDASRPWSNGVLLRDGYAYASNNVTLVRAPVGVNFPHNLSIPVFAIDELLRIDEEPTGMALTQHSVVFEFKTAWLKSVLLSQEWPDFKGLFDINPAVTPTPPGLIEAVATVLPFCPDPKFPIIKFTAEGVSTDIGDFSAEMNNFSLPEGRYHADILLSVLSVAEKINLDAYPGKIAFSGKGIEGVFVGVRS